MTSFIPLYSLGFQYCPRANYKLGKEITDLGCRMTGFKCGSNMAFVTVEQFFINENSDTIIGCIQKCECREDSIYSKNEGKCIKKVWIFFWIVVFIIIFIFEKKISYKIRKIIKFFCSALSISFSGTMKEDIINLEK